MTIQTKTNRLFKYMKWFYMWDFQWEYPTNRCQYFWRVVWAILSMPFLWLVFIFIFRKEQMNKTKPVVILFLLGIFIIGSTMYVIINGREGDFNVFMFIILGLATTVLLRIIIELIIYFVRKIQDRPTKPKKLKKESLLAGYIKDFKNKTCTLINYD